jgi:hypothetical protein
MSAFAQLLRENPDTLKLINNSTKHFIFAPSNHAVNSKLEKRGDVASAHQACQFAELQGSNSLSTQSKILRTALNSLPWANLGRNEPFQVVSQPQGQPGYKLKNRDSNNFTIISGLGAETNIAGKQIDFDYGIVHATDR